MPILAPSSPIIYWLKSDSHLMVAIKWLLLRPPSCAVSRAKARRVVLIFYCALTVPVMGCEVLILRPIEPKPVTTSVKELWWSIRPEVRPTTPRATCRNPNQNVHDAISAFPDTYISIFLGSNVSCNLLLFRTGESKSLQKYTSCSIIHCLSYLPKTQYRQIFPHGREDMLDSFLNLLHL